MRKTAEDVPPGAVPGVGVGPAGFEFDGTDDHVSQGTTAMILGTSGRVSKRRVRGPSQTLHIPPVGLSGGI